MKRLLLAIVLLVSPLCAMDKPGLQILTKINPCAYKAPSRLGKVKLYQTPEGFAVKENGYYQLVKNHEVDSLLTQLHKRKCLSKFLEGGYIAVDKMEDGNFKLTAKMRLEGGGGVCAYWGYWLTKSTIYGACVGVAVTAVPVVVAAAGGGTLATAGGVVAGKAIGAGAGALAGTGVGGSIIGAGAGSVVVSTVGASTVAGTATVAATTAGGSVGFVACVEAASLFVGGLLSVPWLP